MEKFEWRGREGSEGVIYLGNCLNVIKNIPDGSVKVVITDPPYFLGLTHNGQKGSFEDLNIAAPFYKELFMEIKRVLMDDGCVYFFTDWRGYSFYYPMFDEILGAQNLLVWDKGSGCGNFYTYEHEFILFHTEETKFHVKGARNIIRGIPSFASGAKKTNGEKVHPTQKPIELIQKLMLDSTEEGERVLDLFSGSGTTAVTAIRNNRCVIAVELTEKYYRKSIDRVKAELEGE